MDHFSHGDAGWNVPGPIGNRHYARAALVVRAFAFLVRAVVARNLEFGYIGDCAAEHGVAGPAIVAHEDDERVVAHLLLFKRGDDAPDLVVHRGDAARIGPSARIFNVLIAIEILLCG